MLPQRRESSRAAGPAALNEQHSLAIDDVPEYRGHRLHRHVSAACKRPDTRRCRMKALVVTDQAAGAAGMTLVEGPEPPAAINDVIVEIHASGFVPTEMEWPSTWIDRAGRDRTPSILGHELAGVIIALRYGTTGLSVGQRVFGPSDWHRDGTLAEDVAIEGTRPRATPRRRRRLRPPRTTRPHRGRHRHCHPPAPPATPSANTTSAPFAPIGAIRHESPADGRALNTDATHLSTMTPTHHTKRARRDSNPQPSDP